MNQNVTASFGLSLMILLFFAVVLYQPESPRNGREPKATSAADKPTVAEPLPKPELEPKPEPSAVVAAKPPETIDPSPKVVEEKKVAPAPPVAVETPKVVADPTPQPKPEPVNPPATTSAPLRSPSEPSKESRVNRPPVRTPPAPVATPVPAPALAPPGPHNAMTKVADGETLEQFATRVYGVDADPLAVWRSNRDLLNSPTEPIPKGTIFRTP